MRRGVLAVAVVVALFAFVASTTAEVEPLWPHIAFTNIKSDLYLSYYTMTAITGAAEAKWGTATGKYTHHAKGSSRAYEPSLGYCHDVPIYDIKAGQRFYYRVGNDVDGWSTEYTFQLKPDVKPTTSHPVIVPFFGDMGISNSNYTMKALQQIADVDFFYHVGDISYADDRVSSLYQTVWNAWFHNMTNILPYYPYMVLPGNHEAHSNKNSILPWSEKFAVYNYRFHMPGSGASQNNMWYSFDYRNIHFVSISTETDFKGCEFHQYNFGDQLAWLERDLARANSESNRKERPWVVVSGHRPLYSSSSDPYMIKMLQPVRDAFEELFHRHKVDIYFCGHVHAYERTYPVYHNKTESKMYTDPKALVTITTGAAGDTEGPMTDWLSPPPEWSAMHYDKTTGYGILKVNSDTELEWTFYNSENKQIVDHITITKRG